MENCADPNEDDPTLCDMCKDGFFKNTEDNTKCIEECPGDMRTETETMSCE